MTEAPRVTAAVEIKNPKMSEDAPTVIALNLARLVEIFFSRKGGAYPFPTKNTFDGTTPPLEVIFVEAAKLIAALWQQWD